MSDISIVKVEFIQYLRPNGMKSPNEIEIDASELENAEEFAGKVNILKIAKIELSIEVLLNGVVSMSAEDSLYLYANALSPNGPEIVPIIIKFINEAHKALNEGTPTLLDGPDDEDEEPDYD